MSRLALSASRSFDIIELLATFPDRGFSMSEISRATGINIASCHAVLTTLTSRGYLTRSATDKAYKLGLSLIAVGHGAEKSQPMAVRAMEAADKLHRELGVGALLCSAIGDEILAVYSLNGPTGLSPGLHDGERLPLVAPIGAPFVVWTSAEEIEEWLARRPGTIDPDEDARFRRDIALIRNRGYQLYFKTAETTSFASLITEMSATNAVSDYKGKISDLAQSFQYHMAQPTIIEEAAEYDLTLIAAPIFDRNGNPSFNLGLGGFPEPLTGKMINHYAERLLLACLEVMRTERTSGWKRGHARGG